ncbi:MAG: hypothetical protein IT548_01195 [Alphaproteobacteria bacterium]|nr:hypothetical protein [Alphaproteobacteria bacterium]
MPLMDCTGQPVRVAPSRTNMVAEGVSEMHYDIIAAYALGRPTDGPGATAD